MPFEQDDQAIMARQSAGVAGAETLPPFAASSARDLTARLLPPLLAVASVILIWWTLYLIYPRLLPSPLNTVREAIRLVSDGTFFFHMYQSLRRVFVGTTVAMFFSVAIGIYMGTVRMGEQFFQPLVVLGRLVARVGVVVAYVRGFWAWGGNFFSGGGGVYVLARAAGFAYLHTV